MLCQDIHNCFVWYFRILLLLSAVFCFATRSVLAQSGQDLNEEKAKLDRPDKKDGSLLHGQVSENMPVRRLNGATKDEETLDSPIWKAHQELIKILSEKDDHVPVNGRAASTLSGRTVGCKSNRMVGQFIGKIQGPVQDVRSETGWKLGNTVEILTMLSMNPKGELVGSFSQTLPGGFSYSGYLWNAKFLSNQQVAFSWYDMFGTGTLTMQFKSDFNSFNGCWRINSCTMTPHFFPTNTFTWNGYRSHW